MYTINFRLFILSLLLPLFAYKAQAQTPEQGLQIRHIILLADYIAGDYKEAVEKPGTIKNNDEYVEMLEFSKTIEELYQKEKAAKPEIKTDIKALRLAIKGKVHNQKVKKLALGLRKKIIEKHELSVTLARAPDLEKGRDLFARNCVSCHGEKGDSKTPMAQYLKPPPRNLLEEEFLEDLSPSKVYNTMKVGIPGTAMVSYDKLLTEEEKWDLAFYVLSLAAEQQKDLDLTKIKSEILAKVSKILSWSYLASLSNTELEKYLSRQLSLQISKEEVKSLTAKLRLAKFDSKTFILNKKFKALYVKAEQSIDESLAFTLKRLEEVKESFKNKSYTKIHQNLLEAYLEGFENVERKLKILDSSLLQKLERKFMFLRELAAKKSFDQNFSHEMQELEKDLNKAVILLNKKTNQVKSSAVSDLIASALIILREGLEAFLIIIALLSVVKNLGIKSAKKWIHSAWVSAIILGFITFILIEKVFSLSGANRELLEAFFTFLAVVMLFYTGFWMLSQSQRKWSQFITGKSKSELSQGNLWTFFSLAFVAVYREAAETVLFYQALLSTTHNTFMTGAGFVLGLSALLFLCFWIYHYNVRVPIRKFFKITSSLMFALSFILIGKASYELIEANYISQTSLSFIPTIDFIGLYPFVETIIPQILLLCVTLAIVFKFKAKELVGTIEETKKV